jgi:hypothetical protein
MADMRLARVALVVALCLALDVANPLMPGALGFGVQNSVDSRQADRPRVDDVAGPLPPANTREQVDVLDPGLPGLCVVKSPPRLRTGHVPRRIPVAPSAHAAPAASDDH